MSEIVESESSMARPTWQTSAYDTFLATNQESYPGESSNSDEDFDSGDSHEDEYNLDYVEATYHDRFNYQPDSAHLGVSEIGANKFGLYNSSQQFGDIAEEDFSEEVTSFSAVGPHSVQSESATEPLEQQKVLSPFEELTKEAIKSSTSPSGSPRRSIQPPLVSYDEEGLPIVHILKRSDTAPYFRASSKDSSSNRGSCSVTSERSSRLDPHTYQSYAAGILYSSGRSEKFLKLQKNFDALGRLAQLDEKTPQRKDSFGSQEIATSPKDIQEMYTELQSAQNNKEFFFNASNMSDVQWRRDKDKDLSKSAGVRERLNMYQHALGSTGETTTPQHKKAPSLVGNDMKRCISFGELYSIYDKKNSPKNWSSPTTSLGSLDRSYTQQSYIDIKKKAEKEARQIPIYGTHIGPRENPYEKHVKASVQTLKKTFDPELKKLSASTPDISSRTTRNSSPLEVSQSSLDLSTGRQFSRKTESLSDDEGQLVASSLETLPSYSDALSSRIQRHATAHPGVQEHVAPARGGTNIYEIKVEHLKDTKFLEDDGLHVRSSSAPHQGGPLQIAPTSGTLMRSSSSKDTFFGSELTVKDKFAISYKDMPEPVDLKSKKLYSSGYETHVSVPSSSSLGDGSKGQRSSLLEENPPDDPDTQYKGRTQSKDIFAKHLEANQPRKYSSDSSEKTNNSDDASTARFTWKPRTSQNTTSASKGELTETRAATGKYQSPDISQYEELLVRARRERMARKGYLHSYVNDPESAGFQPYTSITDTDFRFRNAYPSELMGQSRTVPNFQTEVLESEPEALPSRPLRVASSGITSMDTQTTHSFLKADTAGYDKPGTPSVTSYQKSHYNNPDLKQKDQPSADHINSTELTSENGSLGKSRISDWRSEISRKTSHVEREPTSILKKENMPDIVLVDKSIANKPFVGSLKEKTEGPTVYNAGIKYHSPDNRQPIMGTKPVSPDQRQPIIETKPVSHDNRQPIIETKLVSHDNRQPSTGTKPDKATFKVTNLRGLAENNEFANPVLPRMKIPEPSSVGGGFMKPVPHPRVPHSSGPPSSSYSEQHVNHEPPKTLPRKYNSSSANISRDERVNVFNQGASTIHYPADNKTGNITRVNSQEKHSGFKNSSADQQASYRNQYGQLRKWTGVSDINHHQEADSSPSASYSSDGSTGTFIINHSEYDKVKADSPRSATENFQSNPISSSQLREPVQANVYKYQPIKFESKMNTLPSNPQPNVGAGHRPASKTKPSVMQLKNVFEQQSPHSSDLMKPLARAKSAPDLSEHGGAKFDRTPVTVVPRTVSGNLADIRKQFEDNRNESKMYSKGSPLHKSENKLFSRPTSSLNVTSSQSVKSSENVTDNKLIDKRREYGVPEIRSSWLGETNSDVKQYPAPHYDPYIPPDDIYKEVEGIREGRKLDVPRKQNHRPSSVSKMTLEYFDHIGSEWQESGRVSGTKVSGPKDASENTSSVKFTVGSTSQTDDMKLSQGRGTEPPRQEPATHPHKPPPPYTTLFPEPRQPQTTSFRLAQDKTSEALHQAGAIQDKTPDVHITNQYRSNNRFNDLQNNKNIKNGENSFRKINENRPLPKAGNPVVINQGTQPTNQSEKIPGKSQLVSVWVHEQENDQQQPPGLPPPPSDSSISSHLSASQPSLKSPLKSPSTLDRKTNKGLIGGQSSPKEKSTYSSSSAQQSAPTSNSSWNNNTSQKFPRASASKDNLRISSSGQNKENQFSRYASTPSLVDSKQNLSPPLTYAGAKGLIGSYENLYGGTRSSDQTQVPSPPKRQTRANGTSMLESWRQPSRASAAEQLGVKSPPPSSAPKDFRHQTSDVIRKSLPVDEKEKKRKEEDEAYRKKRLEELYEEERKKRVQLDAEKESARRHHDFFTPSQKSPISPNRFEEVPDQRRQTLSPAQQRSPNVQTSKLTTTLSVPPERRRGFQIQGKAKALYNFTAQNPRELSFRKGDVLYLLRQIDKNWFEGEHHGQAGIFPANYVEVITSIEAARVAALDAEGQGRAKYNFTGQSSVELSLRKGEFVTLLRRVDDNWLEGKVGGRQGIFPLSYVEIIREPSTPLITPAPSVITTPMTGTPEMLSPVSIEAPTPPPQPSPSAFSLRSPGMQATYGYKPQPAINRFQYDSQSPADLKSPHEFTVYGQKGVLSPPSSRRGPQDRPRPSDTSAVFPSVNLDISTSSSAMGKPRANKVADDDLTLQRHRAIYAYRPQSEDELELKEGDEVFVMEKCDDGWFVGTSARTGNFGTFPGNYVQKYC